MISVVGFDRFLMAFSLAIHIILAIIGIALPLFISISEFIGIRYRDSDYLVLAKRFSIALAVFFAVGTASGTIVAAELFLLWPNFMALVGQVAIVPVYIEVFAFFAEAIFLGIYIYSWDKFKNRYSHWLVSIPAIIGSAFTAILITMLNAFMNTPDGFNIQTYLQNGTISNVNPLAVLSTPSTGIEVIHVLSTSYMGGTFIFAAFVAFMLLTVKDDRKRRYYRKAMNILIPILLISTLVVLVTGILSIQSLYSLQPEKYAAIEADLVSRSNAPELIGGFYINGTYQDYIAIPGLQSMLATGSVNGTVPGLNQYPMDTWPPLIVHVMFDTLVGLGFMVGGFLLLVVLLFIIKWKPLENRLILWLFVIAGIITVFLVELGWSMAEIARQPWIIYNVMTVAQAGNPSPSIIPIAMLLVIFYAVIIPFTLLVLRRIFKERPLEEDLVDK